MGTRMQTLMALVGFAVFLTVDATSVWGGVFPFFPLEFQTATVTLSFYIARAFSLILTFFAGIVLSYRHPALTRRAPVALAAVPLFTGSSLLVAAMYAPEATGIMVIAAGVLSGVGAAVFFMLWQLQFSLYSIERGGLLLILASLLSTVMYLALYLIPIAVTAFLIPLIMVPLSALCLSQNLRASDMDQPMMQDNPRENRCVYQQIVRTYWKSAACIATLGFVSGAIRSCALQANLMTGMVNIASMIGMFFGALVLICVWARHSFNLSIYSSFRIVSPILITVLLFVPLLGGDSLGTIAGFAYMFFAIAIMLMMVHCSQISHNHGVNPVYVYSFFALIVYGMQSVGFLFGEGVQAVPTPLKPLTIVAFVSVWLIAIALIVCDRYPLRLQPSHGMPASSIEFLALRRNPESRGAQEVRLPESKRDESDVSRPTDAKQSAQDFPSHPPVDRSIPRELTRSTARIESDDRFVIKDRVSKKCLAIKERYLLTAREAEIMEYIVRGFTVPSIAAELIISENTVRAHAKHIYTKLDVHKRQELLDLLESI